jgi:preprotein translocase subunit YajC
MKRLAIALAVMGLVVYLMLSEKDKKEIKKKGEKLRKKLKKSRLPGKEILPDD